MMDYKKELKLESERLGAMLHGLYILAEQQDLMIRYEIEKNCIDKLIKRCEKLEEQE